MYYAIKSLHLAVSLAPVRNPFLDMIEERKQALFSFSTANGLEKLQEFRETDGMRLPLTHFGEEITSPFFGDSLHKRVEH